MMQSKINKNTSIEAGSKLYDVIQCDPRILLVLNRFNIPLGFGDKTIQEVCAQHQVDLNCFLFIATHFSNIHSYNKETAAHLNPNAILKYLKNSHTYFLNQRLPDIGLQLKKILKHTDSTSEASILHFFEQYAQEVDEHMNYENETVFPYIESLLNRKPKAGFHIADFQSHHSNIEDKISDLKNLIVRYISLPDTCNYELTNMLFDLFLCEEDLLTHCFIEDQILIPLVKDIEKKIRLAKETHQ